MLDAIILAGTPRKVKHLIRGKHKFFTEVNNNYLGNLVVDALTKSSVIKSIYIIGNKSELEKIVSGEKVRKIIQEKGSFFANAIGAFHHLDDSDHPDKQVLYVSCDIPFLTPTAIDECVRNAPQADFIMPYCLKEDFKTLFPKFEWPFLICREGEIKLGNIALAKPNKVKNKKLFDRFFDLRKVSLSKDRIEELVNIPPIVFEALRLSGKEGVEIVSREFYMRYVTGPLGIKTGLSAYPSIEKVCKIFSKMLRCTALGVRTRYPELCFDIDNETVELKYVQKNYDQIMKRIHSR